MKYTYPQLPRLLEQKIAPVYLIHGDEVHLREQSVEQCQQHILQQGFSRIQKESLDQQLDWSNLALETTNLSLFAEKTCLSLRFLTNKINKATVDSILNYLQTQSAEQCLLLHGPRLDNTLINGRLGKFIDKEGAILTIWPLNANQLQNWIKQRCQTQQLKLDPDALTLLSEYTTGNLVHAEQTIAQLSLLYPQQLIDLTTLRQALSDGARYSPFDLMDSILADDLTLSIRILEYLHCAKQEPNLILWAIHKIFSNLWQLQRDKDNSAKLRQIFQQLRIINKQYQPYQAMLNKFSLLQTENLLLQLQKVDLICKGARPGQPWIALEQIILNIHQHEKKTSTCNFSTWR